MDSLILGNQLKYKVFTTVISGYLQVSRISVLDVKCSSETWFELNREPNFEDMEKTSKDSLIGKR